MKKVHCHPMIRATAIEMAGELYDIVMRDNKVYAKWKKMCPDLTPTTAEIAFIELAYPKLLEQARATLAGLLATNIAQNLKAEIHDALVKDNTLRRGRERLVEVPQQATKLH